MTSDRASGGHHAKRALRATIWAGINSVIPILASFGVFIITAHELTPHQFGVVAFASGLALIGSTLCPSGLGEAIIQRLEISQLQLSSVFWLCISSGIAVYCLECAVAAPLARHFKMQILMTLIPVIATRTIADIAAVVPNALLSRAMSFHLIAMRTLTVSTIAAAITIGLLVAGFGIWALVISQLTSSYVIMLVSFFATKWHPRLSFSFSAIKELLGYGLYSSGTQALSRVFSQNEQILVGLFLGTAQLGIYNFSKQVLNVFNTVVAGSLGSVAHPMFSGIQNDLERVKRGFLNATFVSSLIAFPMFIGLALVAPQVVPFAFGLRWLAAVPLVQLQCLLGLTTCIGVLQYGLISSQGKANWWFYYQLLQLGGTALCIVFLAHFGLVVMLSAIVAKSYMLWFIPIRNSLTLLSMRAKEYLLNFRAPATGSLFMGLAILGANHILTNFNSLEIFILDVIVGVVVYGSTVFAVDAGRIQVFIALIAPKFKKSVRVA